MDALVEFLLARLAEQAAVARVVQADLAKTRAFLTYDMYEQGREVTTTRHLRVYEPAEVLAEVAAKRRIIERWQSMSEESSDPCESGWAQGLGEALRLLGVPYAGHPDYRQEWKL